MRKLIPLLASAVLCLALVACATPTANQSAQMLTASAALTQANGAATALAVLLEASPLDATVKAQAVAAAKTVAALTSTSASALSSAAAGQIQQAAQTVADAVPQVVAAVDPDAGKQVSNWAGWLSVALRAAGVVAAVVTGS